MLCGLEIHQRLSGRKLFCSCMLQEGSGAAGGAGSAGKGAAASGLVVFG
jgi:hypothetical protein